MKNEKRLGRLFGVGVGPGDPELLTLKAHRILSEVPVIFVPVKDEKSRSYAGSVIRNSIEKSDERITELVFPMLRDREQLAVYWQRAVESICQHLEKGNDCAFVNVGDPFLYGSFIYIMEILRENYPDVEIEVIPGISSINAAAARAMVPLASDDDNLVIISGNPEEKTIKDALNGYDTVIFLKVNTAFDKLIRILEGMNLSEKGVYVRRCTTQDEEIIYDISSLKGKNLDYFSLLIVRK